MENITAPAVLQMPFAQSGQKNNIPAAPTGTNQASLQEGFPPVTMQETGGEPPDGKDFNGLGNLMSQFYFAFQNGWLPTFEAEVSASIGGYPKDSVLWYAGENGLQALQSTKGNNTDNFNTDPSVIGASWKPIIPTEEYVKQLLSKKADKNLVNTNMLSNCILAAPRGVITGGDQVFWYDSWRPNSSLKSQDRGAVKLSSTSIGSTNEITIDQLNGDWSVINKIKMEKSTSGSYSLNGVFSQLSFYNPDLGSGSVSVYIELNDRSGTTTQKPFHVRIFPSYGNTTNVYKIEPTFVPVVDTWYWVKLQKSGSTYTLSYSLDGNSYSALGSVANVPAFSNAPAGLTGRLTLKKPQGNGNIYADLSSNAINNLFLGTANTPLVVYQEGYSTNITAKSGLSVLIPNGRDENGNLQNIAYTLPEDVLYSPNADGTWLLQLLTTGDMSIVFKDYYFEQDHAPANKAYTVWFNTEENVKYLGNGSTWTRQDSVMLGEYTFSGGVITSLKSFCPVDLTLAMKPDMSNASGVLNADYVVNNWNDAYGNWWRKWRSGKIEQGGVTTVSNGTTQNFLLPFTDFATIGFLATTQFTGGNSGDASASVCGRALSVTTFGLNFAWRNYGAATQKWAWLAVGY